MNELLVAALLGVPALGALLAWGRPGPLGRRISVASFSISAVAGLAVTASTLASGPYLGPGAPLGAASFRAFDGLVVVDALGAGLLGLVLVVAALALAASPRYLDHELATQALRPGDESRYYALFLGFVACLCAVPLLDSLGLLWVAIEAGTVVSALLVGITRTPQAIEAAWKYLVLGTVGVGFALLGTMLAYASSIHVLGETSDALAWTRLVAIAPQLDPGLMRLAFVFALVGYGTKTGLAPFHTWLPDTHSQAPSPISALLSGASLVVALYALARFHLVAVGTLGPSFSSSLLIAIGLLSLVVAVPFLVAQEDLKRLLAYSSIEHMGLLTLGLGFGGEIALVAVVLHAALHALLKTTAFLAAGELVQRFESRQLARIRGASRDAPAASWALVAAIAALGGLPPSGVFVTELAIIVGGFLAGHVVAAAIGALLAALAFVALAFYAARVAWGRPAAGLRSTVMGRRAVTWLALPLGVAGLLGVWLPAPISVAVTAVGGILGGSHG